MAIVSIERNEIYADWKDENGMRVLKSPKPSYLRGRVTVYVPDNVVRNKETQTVINAYAGAINKPDFIGKTAEQLEQEYQLLLGFHVIHFDDGTDPKAWMEAQKKA